MTERQRLPNRRASRLLDFEAMNLNFVASVSHFANGAIAEIFIDEKARCGSTIGTLCKDLAVTFSLAVQSGADPDHAIAKAVRSARLVRCSTRFSQTRRRNMTDLSDVARKALAGCHRIDDPLSIPTRKAQCS
jgi:hypothetical protein